MAKILLGRLIGSLESCHTRESLQYMLRLTSFTLHHNSITLGYLQDALDEFHKHKFYFIETNVHKHFNIPKFHSLMHYVEFIKLFGTTDRDCKG